MYYGFAATFGNELFTSPVGRFRAINNANTMAELNCASHGQSVPLRWLTLLAHGADAVVSCSNYGFGHFNGASRQCSQGCWLVHLIPCPFSRLALSFSLALSLSHSPSLLVYDMMANTDDLDVWLHVGDLFYEYPEVRETLTSLSSSRLVCRSLTRPPPSRSMATPRRHRSCATRCRSLPRKS